MIDAVLPCRRIPFAKVIFEALSALTPELPDETPTGAFHCSKGIGNALLVAGLTTIGKGRTGGEAC